MRFSFRRTIRTASSEQWMVFNPNDRSVIGLFDIHIQPNDEVQASLMLTQSLAEDDLDRLITEFDDDVVNMADLDKGNFFLNIFKGEEVGYFQIQGGEQTDDAS